MVKENLKNDDAFIDRINNAKNEDDIDNPERKKEEEEEIVLKISKAQTRKDLADLFNEVGKHKGYNALLLKREKELIDLGLIQPKKPK